MPDDLNPHPAEPDAQFNFLTGAVIGAAIEVHRILGPGLDESLYEAALAIELGNRSIAFTRQSTIPVQYKGVIIGDKRLDFVVENKLVIELKAIEEIAPVHKAQVLTYLRITGHKLGLLINFNTKFLKDGITRIIRPD